MADWRRCPLGREAANVPVGARISLCFSSDPSITDCRSRLRDGFIAGEDTMGTLSRRSVQGGMLEHLGPELLG